MGAPAIASGSRVRIFESRTPSSPLLGTIQRLERDSLLVALAGGNTLHPVALSSIDRLEVSAGRQPKVLRGIGRGLLGGVALGSFLGFFGTDDGGSFGRGFGAVVGGIAVGSLGVVVGGITGVVRRQETWRRVDPRILEEASARQGPGQ